MTVSAERVGAALRDRTRGRPPGPETRLLDRADGARIRVRLGAVCGLVAAALVVVQAFLLSVVVAGVFRDGLALGAVAGPLAAIAVLAIARAPLLLGADVLAQA